MSGAAGRDVRLGGRSSHSGGLPPPHSAAVEVYRSTLPSRPSVRRGHGRLSPYSGTPRPRGRRPDPRQLRPRQRRRLHGPGADVGSSGAESFALDLAPQAPLLPPAPRRDARAPSPHPVGWSRGGGGGGWPPVRASKATSHFLRRRGRLWPFRPGPGPRRRGVWRRPAPLARDTPL